MQRWLLLLIILFPMLLGPSAALQHPLAAPQTNLRAASGDLDPAFGSGGTRTTAVSPFDDQANALAVQSDGRIVVAGWASGSVSTDVVVLRYTADGTLDPTFDGDGIVLTDFGGDDRAAALVVQPDGKLVVAGWSDGSGSHDFAVARYTSDGTLDPTFDSDGKVISNFFTGNGQDSFGSDDEATSLVLQPDGKLVVAGNVVRCSANDCNADVGLVRYLPNGGVDTSFDGDGKATTDLSGSFDEAAALIRQPDGKLVIAGSNGTGFALARYGLNGSLDSTFDSDGRVTTPFSGSEAAAFALVMQSDGKLVAAGRTTDNGDVALVRYQPNGRLDPTFGSDGKVTTDFGGDDWAVALLQQSDGKLVVAGRSNAQTTTDFALARYLADGVLDVAFGSDGMITTDFGGNDRAAALAVQADGKLVAVGTTRKAAFDDIALARYLQGAVPTQHTVYLPVVFR